LKDNNSSISRLERIIVKDSVKNRYSKCKSRLKEATITFSTRYCRSILWSSSCRNI